MQEWCTQKGKNFRPRNAWEKITAIFKAKPPFVGGGPVLQGCIPRIMWDVLDCLRGSPCVTACGRPFAKIGQIQEHPQRSEVRKSGFFDRFIRVPPFKKFARHDRPRKTGKLSQRDSLTLSLRVLGAQPLFGVRRPITAFGCFAAFESGQRLQTSHRTSRQRSQLFRRGFEAFGPRPL